MTAPTRSAVRDVLLAAGERMTTTRCSAHEAITHVTDDPKLRHLAARAWAKEGGEFGIRFALAARQVMQLTQAEWDTEQRRWRAYVERLIRKERKSHAALIAMYEAWLADTGDDHE